MKKKNCVSLTCRNNIHFIGIGGIGMSSIANFLIKKGYKISGSDLKSNSIIKKLKKKGIKIYLKHSYKNIFQSRYIIVSSAIEKYNVEIVTAKILKIPILKRAQLLSIIMKNKYSIAVAGSHGKTTTTGIIFSIYYHAKLQPNLINGGVVNEIKESFKIGNSKYLIVEADESDGSLIYLKPNLIILTNIEFEHINNYQNNFNNLKKTFIKFLNNISYNGTAILCADNVSITKITKKIKINTITYGFNKKSDFCIVNYYQIKFYSYFSLMKDKKIILNVRLKLPGKHNVLNATAAIITAIIHKIKLSTIYNTLKNFKGIKRRFELLGYFKVKMLNNIYFKLMMLSDYGHHPNEILSNIKTIRTGWVNKKITMIFQPHRFTRTYDLFNRFVQTLSLVDNLILLNIYSAHEKKIFGFNSFTLCKQITTKNKLHPILITDYNCIFKTLKKMLTGKDILLIQGAGNVEKIIYKYLIPKLTPIT